MNTTIIDKGQTQTHVAEITNILVRHLGGDGSKNAEAILAVLPNLANDLATYTAGQCGKVRNEMLQGTADLMKNITNCLRQ